jgi:hypothetical protein
MAHRDACAPAMEHQGSAESANCGRTEVEAQNGAQNPRVKKDSLKVEMGEGVGKKRDSFFPFWNVIAVG